MKKLTEITVGFILLAGLSGFGQTKVNVKYYAGFKTLKLVDTSRIYKPNTTASDSLHYRPVELDIWYPASNTGSKRLAFGDLFRLFELRANQYQDTNYTGIVDELAQFYAMELGLEIDDGRKLLQAETNSYADAELSKKSFPLIIYMAGFNGMGFENFRILEGLAERGFIVASVWSMGGYPGNMTNQEQGMMEQVYDAEFVFDYLKSQDELNVQVDTIGVLGCSWGGMSAAVLADRNPMISTFASLDGTETHYFGQSDQDDAYIKEIHHSNLLKPERNSFAYLYLESGNKLNEHSPTEEYHYYKKLSSSKKYYLRLLNSRHEDFTSIPSTLQASGNAIEIHNEIMELTLSFFEKHLLNLNGFDTYYTKLSLSDNVSTKPFDRGSPSNENILIQGEILNSKTALPLAYVNIGILNKEVGTVSNEAGKYELQLQPGMETDTIRISMIGFKARTFTVAELLSNTRRKIKLEEEISQLTEVIVSAKGLKKKNLGNRTTSRFVSTGFGYDKLGAEIGIRVNVREQPTFVDAFNFNISYNRLSAKALFRLNIYEIENGKPSQNIMRENIIIPVDAKQTGLISVDLKKYNIILKGDVVVTIEWVGNEGENKKGEAIFLSLGFLNAGTLIRPSSQGKFKKHSSMGVGMNLDVRYY